VTWLFLAAAISCEVAGTLGLRSTVSGLNPLPVALIALAYATSFCFLALALRGISVGVAYAIWSAVGTAAVAAAGAVIFDERLTPPVILGLTLVVAGVVVLVSVGAR
jgi:small multidrug resistance pump